MKVAPVIRILAGVAILLVVGGQAARAQSEVDPNHFDSPNTERFPQPQGKESAVVVTEQRFNGTFMLPHTVKCGGKRLVAGHYSVLASVVYVALSGNARRLLAIRLAELDLVFDANQQLHQGAGGRPARIEKLSLLLVSPQK